MECWSRQQNAGFSYLLLWSQSVQIPPHLRDKAMKDFANEQTQKCVFLCLSIHCRILSHWICSMLFIGRLYFRGGIICPKSALLSIYLTRTLQAIPGWRYFLQNTVNCFIRCDCFRIGKITYRFFGFKNVIF